MRHIREEETCTWTYVLPTERCITTDLASNINPTKNGTIFSHKKIDNIKFSPRVKIMQELKQRTVLSCSLGNIMLSKSDSESFKLA